MTEVTFVDTNILVYAKDDSNPEKQSIALKWLRKLWDDGNARTSTQVLNEYFVTTTRKLKPGLSNSEAWNDIQDFMVWNPIAIDRQILTESYKLFNAHSLSWWDSLIVASAVKENAVTLLSEDLNNGQKIAGVTILNPFLAPHSTSINNALAH